MVSPYDCHVLYDDFHVPLIHDIFIYVAISIIYAFNHIQTVFIKRSTTGLLNQSLHCSLKTFRKAETAMHVGQHTVFQFLAHTYKTKLLFSLNRSTFCKRNKPSYHKLHHCHQPPLCTYPSLMLSHNLSHVLVLGSGLVLRVLPISLQTHSNISRSVWAEIQLAYIRILIMCSQILSVLCLIPQNRQMHGKNLQLPCPIMSGINESTSLLFAISLPGQANAAKVGYEHRCNLHSDSMT